MAGVLTLTSHTFRTSPTQRGKYVLGVISARRRPAAGECGHDQGRQARGKKRPPTFREQLARHATQAACAGCHRKIDPLGFALDNYNAVGTWREGTPEIRSTCQECSRPARAIQGAGDLKKVLLARKDDFARNVVGRMMVYALGRELDDFDDCAVEDALSALRKDDYRFSALILGVADSVPFRNRPGLGLPATEGRSMPGVQIRDDPRATVAERRVCRVAADARAEVPAALALGVGRLSGQHPDVRELREGRRVFGAIVENLDFGNDADQFQESASSRPASRADRGRRSRSGRRLPGCCRSPWRRGASPARGGSPTADSISFAHRPSSRGSSQRGRARATRPGGRSRFRRRRSARSPRAPRPCAG